MSVLMAHLIGIPRRHKGLALLAVLILSFAHSCVHRPQNIFVKERPPHHITVMAYNVENLFDTQHDPGKEDFTFLPLAEKKKNPEAQAFCANQKGAARKDECLNLDWNKKTLNAKMKNLAKVIFQVYGEGPDILMLEEVENIKVLTEWVQNHLGQAGYQTIELIEGDDPRGIDVALVSRFPKAGEARLHQIEWNRALELVTRPTRGILEVPLRISDEAIIHVFVVHLPSQGAPTPFRQDAIDTIIKLVSQVPKDRYWIVGGDWNITAEEDEKFGLVSKTLSQVGLVSHILGCHKCRGTHNYQRAWSFLDILLFSPNFQGGGALTLSPDSITTPMWAEGQLRVSGRPNRFSPEELTGASDHLPIYAEIISNLPISQSAKTNSPKAVGE